MDDLTEIKLEKGQIISFIFYHGTNIEKTLYLYNQLENKRFMNIDIPLTNTYFNLRLIENELITTEIAYEIKMRGELI